jgi:succinate dehydrogenase/fumarate reductase flavoprotein subunit
VGPYVSKPDRRYGDMIIEVNKALFSEYAESGRGPVYMDCRDISNEDYEYMTHWFQHEGFQSALNHFEEEGIDLRKHAIEWATYGKRGSGGSISQNRRGETSLKGLFVAGDETTRSISPAAAMGWIAGENAATFAKKAESIPLETFRDFIEEKASLLDEIRKRDLGPDWEEVNIALQQIMNDYAGSVRSETLLEAGLRHLRRLRHKAETTMIARNEHELLRAMEVINLMDVGEMIFVAASARKETRGLHVRSDYGYTDPLLDKRLVIKKVEGKPVAEWQ